MDVTPQSQRSWRRFVLPCSLLLNLFLIALIGGRLLYGRAERLAGTSMLSRLTARAEAVLPRQEAQAFKAVIEREAPRFAGAREELGAARDELMRRVTADPYDKQAALQAFFVWKKAWDGFSTDFSDTLADALTQVSAEGRRKLVAGRFGRPYKE